METLFIERLGGLAGFGGSRSKLRSRGRVDMSTLSTTERAVVESLFASRSAADAGALRDGFRYRISRTTPTGVETIEACEATVPAALTRCIREELT